MLAFPTQLRNSVRLHRCSRTTNLWSFDEFRNRCASPVELERQKKVDFNTSVLFTLFFCLGSAWLLLESVVWKGLEWWTNDARDRVVWAESLPLELKREVDRDAQSTSITAQIYNRVRTDILTGVYEPGQKLKIDELRQVYGSGSSPIREALSLLTSDKLVERVDQRGFRVALVSAEAFDELLMTRCWLEERALNESIDRGGKEWEERVVLAEYHLSRTERSTSRNAFIANQEWERCHKAFHMALISACGSSILLNFCDQLYDQNIRYRHVAGKVAYPKRNITKEHKAIMQAALDRDIIVAVACLLDHYRATGSFLTKALPRGS